MNELRPAKSPIKRPRNHDYYWFIGPDRPFIAELIDDHWKLPGETPEYSTADLEDQELYRWRRVQFPVDLRTAYDLPRGYGKQDREKMIRIKSKQKMREEKARRKAKKEFHRKEVRDMIATRRRRARGKD